MARGHFARSRTEAQWKPSALAGGRRFSVAERVALPPIGLLALVVHLSEGLRSSSQELHWRRRSCRVPMAGLISPVRQFFGESNTARYSSNNCCLDRRRWQMLLPGETAFHFSLPNLAVVIRGPMFTFAYIAGGLIIACTVFALVVPSGPEVTLSDIAARMERMPESDKAGRDGARTSAGRLRSYRSRHTAS